MINDVLVRIQEQCGTLPQPAAVDLLYLAITAYAADLRVPRRLATDGWSREFLVYLPVQDLALWSNCASSVERLLGFLTGDRWSLQLRSRPSLAWVRKRTKLNNVQHVCLLSGGLDSLVGAADLLAEGKFVALVGHHGSGITNSVQARVLGAVKHAFGATAAPFMLHAQPPKRNVDDGERTMRSRSILFFAMGIAVADALGEGTPLVVPENGLISLNVPLTSARTGSRSTRTTHPHYVSLFRILLAHLGLAHEIQMPYRFRTKGEMLLETKAPALIRETAPLTMSCSHPEMGRYRFRTVNNHCGYCVPCIIRRAAMTAAGLPDAPYNVDIRVAPPDNNTGAGSDYRAFLMAVERCDGMTENRAVAEVLRPGPLPSEEVRELAGVYLRGMDEVRRLLLPGST